MLDVRLLGTFSVRYKRKAVEIPSRAAQSLFAYLILSAGTSHRREKLAGLLWPDSTEESARDYLRHALWRVRKSLPTKPEYLLADDLSLSFDSSAEFRLDTADLEHAREDASADELIQVLPAYQGELLPGFYDDWVVLEREHLASVFEHKMARLLSLLEQAGRWLDILDWGERWIKLGQKPEPAYRALMMAHAAKGDMSKVAAAYERCIKSLREYGMEPSEQTRLLYENLKSGKELPAPKAAARPAEPHKAARTNLPTPFTSFIGREREVEAIVRSIGKNRLTTLTGSGGVGKTRLAIEAARRLTGKFKDGVWWVDLVGLNDPSLVPQAVAQVLDLREARSQPLIETLIEGLAAKHSLLVLDNCEHLISACAALAERLLGGCPGLRLLATSREALDIPGETVWAVPSLSLPDREGTLTPAHITGFEGIRLFLDRAVLAQPRFELTSGNAQAVAQICERLGGIPLAIELAAARVRMLSAAEIAERLDDRFSLLTGGSRTVMPRHQTLRATMDWSHDLLTEPERTLFRRLAPFPGGFTLEAAEAVCAYGELERSIVLDLLGRLVDKSLVIAEQAPEAGETRFRMLETIRQYASSKLDEREAAEIRDRQLAYLVEFIEKAEPQLELADQGSWLDRLEAEMDNIRAAIDWALERRDVNSALRIGGSLRRFWLIRNHDYEGFERLKTILLQPGEPTSARLRAMNTFFFLLWPQGRLIEAVPLIEAAVALGEELDDQWNTAFALLWAGMAASESGDFRSAEGFLERSYESWHAVGDTLYPYSGMSLAFLGDIALIQGDYERARSCYERAGPRLREVGDLPFLGLILRRLGQLALQGGQPGRAIEWILESLEHNWHIRDYRGTGACLAALGSVSLAQGDHPRAITLFGAVDAVIRLTRIPLLPFDQHEYEGNVQLARSSTTEPVFAKAWARGAAMNIEQAVHFGQEYIRQRA